MTHLTKAFIYTWVLTAIASTACLFAILTNEPFCYIVGLVSGLYPLYRWFYHMIHTVDDRKESETND